MREILVTGSSGLVGSRVKELYSRKEELLTPNVTNLDITSSKSVRKYFEENAPDIVINLAAYTNVDGAEKERGDKKGTTWRLNVDGVKNLAEMVKKRDGFLIHFSTDFVFKGSEEDPGPYLENDEPPNVSDGISWYGWSKNRSEKMLKSLGIRHAIVRIAYPFCKAEYSQKLDFAKGFLKLFDENKLYPVFSDQVLSVLNIDSLMMPLDKIIGNQIEGIFHIVSSNTTTPFEFVSYLLEKTRGVKNVLQEGSMKEFLSKEGRTPRPRLGGLSTKLTEKKLGIKLPTWKEMVDDFVI